MNNYVINVKPKEIIEHVEYILRTTLNNVPCVEEHHYLGKSKRFYTIDKRTYFKDLEKAKKFFNKKRSGL